MRGVRYINDSKATNVNSCWYALQSLRTPTVLILGGTDKGNDYSEIAQLVKDKVHTLIFLGLDNSKLFNYFEGFEGIAIIAVNFISQAVDAAYKVVKKREKVLLSTCFARFDLYINY